MNELREYYIIEFKEPLVMDLDRYICVPKTWVSRPFSDTTSLPATVVVKYPLEKQSITRARVRKYENYDEDWKIYIAFVKIKTDNYKDAMTYIKLLHKSNDAGHEHNSEQTNRAESNQSGNMRRDDNQNNQEPHPSDGHGSSTESPPNKKSATKSKYTRKSQINTGGDNCSEQGSANKNTKCEAVSKDHEILKNDLMGFFNKFLPLIEKMETNIMQNSITLEKILTILASKSDRPIDEIIPNVSKDAAESNAENSETTTEDANKATGTSSVPSTSVNTTPVEEIMEVEDETEVRTEGNTDVIDNLMKKKEDSAPAREGIKRKLVDTDANVPMKKRDGPRNPTLQNSQCISDIPFNKGTVPEHIASISADNRENYVFSHQYISFISDALKISSLYQKN